MTLPLTTHQMAKKFGVTPRTLRHYDAIGLLHPDRIGSLRMFGSEDQQAMLVIDHGKRMGMSLEQIKDAMAADRSHLTISRNMMDALVQQAAAQRAAVEDTDAMLLRAAQAAVTGPVRIDLGAST